jgi:hypothetical protein
MEKRYQVFISSTYADLKEERRAVTQTVIELDCIPAGMELFPAADEEQMAFIRRVIDDCDYYLLIIGGRYGSVSESGISYTEQEYDYAISRGLKVIALIHENPDEIPLGKSEKDPALQEKLKKFREKAAHGRLVKFWKTAAELPGLVALSLSSTIKMFPAVGWARANRIANVDVLNEVNELRKQNADLQSKLAEVSANPILPDLAGLDESIGMRGSWMGDEWFLEITWRKIFGYIAPHLQKHPHSEPHLRGLLCDALLNSSGKRNGTLYLDEESFQTIAVQLMALDLVSINSKIVSGDMTPFWSLTASGQRRLFDILAVRTKEAGSPAGTRG